jgi:uncharacterized protein (TIGR02302 family)
MDKPDDSTARLGFLARPLRLTLLGLWAERLWRAFWPLWSVLAASLSALAFGLQDVLPLEVAWSGLILAGLAIIGTGFSGIRKFRRPTRAEALIRIDARLPGQPIAAMTDTQALGTDDPASLALWQAHRARMAARAAKARAVKPDLNLSSRDPFALRYLAATALVMALIFGSLWRITSIQTLAPGAGVPIATGPMWEGWAQPPAYTGKPTLYLNDLADTRLDLPRGTRLQFRLYGEVGEMTLAETVSNRTEVPPASDPAHDFTVVQAGKITIDGPGGRAWDIGLIADLPPTVTPSDKLARESDGKLKQDFTASDDFGVVAGQVTIALDLPKVERIFGRTIEPEPREPVVLDLPMPNKGNRSAFTETLMDDLSQHPFANLPVTMAFQVSDAAGQTGSADALHVVLPGRGFFDPLAAALIEQRQALLWNRANAPLVSQILKAVTWKPEGFIRNERAYLRLRVVMRDLEDTAANLTADKRDTIAEELWQIALLVEEGDLASKLEALRRAQDRLDEAIKNGASPEEIDKLMQEMQQALDDYMQERAEQAERNPDSQMSQNMDGMEMSGDQIQQMLDELKKLMEEGRTAEAQELMEMLRQLMENMQVVQGEGGQGQGQGAPGQQAMRDLQDTLREQQGLSDDAFRDLQDGQEGNEGQQGQNGQQQGQQGQGGDQEGQDGRSLAERQQDLRDRLGQLQDGPLPGDGSEQGEAGRQELERAGRAMEQAEDALRDGDLPQALDRQAEAMEAMREGMRELGEALAEQQRQPGDAQPGQEFGQADPRGQRDPLGREPGESARIGSDRNMLQGDDVYRRAQDLLDEIRKRSGEQTRPEGERDYLRRLLDMF